MLCYFPLQRAKHYEQASYHLPYDHERAHESIREASRRGLHMEWLSVKIWLSAIHSDVDGELAILERVIFGKWQR